MRAELEHCCCLFRSSRPFQGLTRLFGSSTITGYMPTLQSRAINTAPRARVREPSQNSSLLIDIFYLLGIVSSPARKPKHDYSAVRRASTPCPPHLRTLIACSRQPILTSPKSAMNTVQFIIPLHTLRARENRPHRRHLAPQGKRCLQEEPNLSPDISSTLWL